MRREDLEYTKLLEEIATLRITQEKAAQEIVTLRAIQRKTEAEHCNLLPAKTAHRLQRVQPWLGGAAVAASLTFALVTWITKEKEIAWQRNEKESAQEAARVAKAEKKGAESDAQSARLAQTEAEEALRKAIGAREDAIAKTEELTATVDKASEQLTRIQAEVKNFGKEPFDWAEGIKKASGSSADAAKLASQIQDWLVRHGVIQAQPIPEDPLKELREPFRKAATALFALPPGKWTTPEFFDMLRLCRQDRRYVGMLVEFAMREENAPNETGWLYAAFVFRNIAYEDSEKNPKRFTEYASELVPFLSAALSRSGSVREQAKDIFNFLPKPYRLKNSDGN